jgi:acyl-CoA synthetase (AMP-forming)/AMP-acid ligase II/acyl carrier protein
VVEILLPFFTGSTSVLMSPTSFLKNPYIWFKTITEYHATLIGAPNFAYDYCVENISSSQKELINLSTVRIAINLSEPIDINTLERFYNAFKDRGLRKEALNPCYSLTETTIIGSATPPLSIYQTVIVSNNALKKGIIELCNANQSDIKYLVSCGTPMSELIHITIVNPETHKRCEKNEIGEIWINSPVVAQGYWQKIEETNETFQAHIIDDQKKIPYLRTGDLGFMWENYLYVIGRIKDMIILRGSKYYPQDIENVVCNCHPLTISNGCVAFSINEDNQEHLSIVCEVKDINLPSQKIEICEAIQKNVLEKIGLAVHTIYLIQPGTLPRTISQKIQRQFTKKLLETNQLVPIFQRKKITRNTIQMQKIPTQHINSIHIEQWLVQWLINNKKLLPDEIQMQKPISYFGIDSLDLAKLAKDIEEWLQIKIDWNAFENYPTIKKLANHIFNIKK